MSSLMHMCAWLIKNTVIQTSHLHVSHLTSDWLIMVACHPAEQHDIVKPVETRDFRTSCLIVLAHFS